MLSCGSILTYTTFDKIFNSDIIFVAKFVLVLVYILTFGTIIFLLIKLRLLFVNKGKLTSFYLFRLKKTTILLDEIVTSKWTTWDIKAHKFISLTITDKSKNKVSLSDLEFENFDRIAKSVLGDKYLDKSLNHYKEQAKHNNSLTYFIAIITTILLIYCISKLDLNTSLNMTHAFILISILTILATLKRIKKYRNIEKYGI